LTVNLRFLSLAKSIASLICPASVAFTIYTGYPNPEQGAEGSGRQESLFMLFHAVLTGLFWWKVNLVHEALMAAHVALSNVSRLEWQAAAGGRGCRRRPERVLLRVFHSEMLGQDGSFGVILQILGVDWALTEEERDDKRNACRSNDSKFANLIMRLIIEIKLKCDEREKEST
jgi:hypothetical protein